MSARIVSAADDWHTAYIGARRIGDYSTWERAREALRRQGWFVEDGK